MLNEVLNSEYNNAGELFGLDAANHILQNGSPAQKATMLKKIAASGKSNESRGSRAEFEKFMGQMPAHIKEGLRSGKLRLADYTIYSIKPITSKTIKMFESQDVKEVGVRNVSNAKLPKNMVMLVSGIYVLAGTKPGSGDDPHKRVPFNTIEGALTSGEYSFKSNKKQLIPENNSLRNFMTDNDTTVRLGYYKLDNPRVILDDEVFEFTIDLGTDEGLTSNDYIFVGLNGTITTP